MKNSTIINLFSLVAASALFFGCGSGNSNNVTTEDTKKNEVVKEVYQYPLPSAFDITKMLNEAGASFVLSITNPAANSDKYFTETEKALNLGIYGADLAYATTYEMKQETMAYMKAAKQLIDGMNISSNFNLSFAQRVEANLDNKDSLISLVSNSFFDSYQFLKENGKDNLSLLVMTGSFIEGLYITSQISATAAKPEAFNKILANQKSAVQKLVELLEPVKADENIAGIYTDMKGLLDLYSFEGEVKAEQASKISAKVNEIRAKFI